MSSFVIGGIGSEKNELKGHKGSVLCLDVNHRSDNNGAIFASGSEDSTVRIWDLRINR